MISELTNPTKVVQRAVLIPTAMSANACCNVAAFVTSTFANAVPNIIKKPVTVPTIPSARHDSDMNHPTSLFWL